MKRDPKIDVLRSLQLFDRCSPKEISVLARLCTTIEVAEGRTLTVQGQRGEELFVILSGTADVVVDGELLTMTGPGQVVGEMALLDDQPRMATVTATTAVEALVMSGHELRSAVDTSPALGTALLATMRQRRPAEERVSAAR